MDTTLQLSSPSAAPVAISSTKALHAFEHLCRINTMHGGADEPPRYTHFHASALPSRSLLDYLGVLATLCRVGREGIVLGLATVYRYCEATGMMPSLLSAHRLCLTGIMLACKAHHDDHMSNRRFADAGGVSVAELCSLEWRMAIALGFNLTVPPEEYQLIGAGLRSICSRCTVTPPFRPHVACRRRTSGFEHLTSTEGCSSSAETSPCTSPQYSPPFVACCTSMDAATSLPHT